MMQYQLVLGALILQYCHALPLLKLENNATLANLLSQDVPKRGSEVLEWIIDLGTLGTRTFMFNLGIGNRWRLEPKATPWTTNATSNPRLQRTVEIFQRTSKRCTQVSIKLYGRLGLPSLETHIRRPSTTLPLIQDPTPTEPQEKQCRCSLVSSAPTLAFSTQASATTATTATRNAKTSIFQHSLLQPAPPWAPQHFFIVGQWESKAPDCEKAAECPSHQNRPISAYTAGCTARMFCRSISKLIQIESQKEQTRWSSAEVFASTAVKLRAETNLCAGCACIPHQVFPMSIILSVYTKTPKDTIVHGYPKIGTPTDRWSF